MLPTETHLRQAAQTLDTLVRQVKSASGEGTTHPSHHPHPTPRSIAGLAPKSRDAYASNPAILIAITSLEFSLACWSGWLHSLPRWATTSTLLSTTPPSCATTAPPRPPATTLAHMWMTRDTLLSSAFHHGSRSQVRDGEALVPGCLAAMVLMRAVGGCTHSAYTLKGTLDQGPTCPTLHVPEEYAGETVVYDPRYERAGEWAPLETDREELCKAVRSLDRKSYKMQPWDALFMKNPIPHRVIGPTKGDRLVLVGFVGMR